MAKVLERNIDGKPNYECRVLVDNMEDGKPITHAALRRACTGLFAGARDEVLFYFSGMAR